MQEQSAAHNKAAFLRQHLAAGEIYAGLILGQDGQPDYHLFLLPGDVSKPWKEALAWAKELDGDLPTRKEQALLFANAANHFQRDWYWSNTQHADNADYAWCQNFDNGYQDNHDKSASLRARAVRRLPI